MTMKKVKYIRPIKVSPFDKNFKQRSYAVGEISELNDDKAEHFVLLGYVEIIEDEKPATKADKPAPIDTSEPKKIVRKVKQKATPKPKAE